MLAAPMGATATGAADLVISLFAVQPRANLRPCNGITSGGFTDQTLDALCRRSHFARRN